jgi:hypothetical protein
MKNIFKGMSWYEIGLVFIAAVASAILVVAVLAGIIDLLPVAEKSKSIIFFVLGLTSISIGYWVLLSMTPKTQQATPIPPKIKTGFIEVCRLVREMKRNFSHTPVMPHIAVAMHKAPTMNKRKIINALRYIISSFCKLFIRNLHNVL